MVRGGDPDAIDSIVPMAYGNLALNLILKGVHGRLVVLKNGRYDNMPDRCGHQHQESCRRQPVL